MSQRIGCSACNHGEVFYFFKDERRMTVRSDFLYCRNCYPDSTGTIQINADEEIISVDEFLGWLDEGWQELES